MSLLAHVHLAELLDFRPDQGIIRLHEQRVVRALTFRSNAASFILKERASPTARVWSALRPKTAETNTNLGDTETRPSLARPLPFSLSLS